ncbi:MAG: rRNA maturation RNase YbeY [Rickettsiales bacterium]|jgi:probable rRNA maturation factor|nr:rRNA maturation RNase YbeY [Rickettsiales bacterium]
MVAFTLKIPIALEDRRWSRVVGVARVRLMAKNIFVLLVELLGYRIERGATVEISIVLTSDKRISILNENTRNVAGPTNVLSFPIYEREFIRYSKYEKYMPLGDIVLSLDTLEKECLEQNKFFGDHLSLLVVHSLLHLLGFDHRDDAEAEDMEKAEIVILHRLKNMFFRLD